MADNQSITLISPSHNIIPSSKTNISPTAQARMRPSISCVCCACENHNRIPVVLQLLWSLMGTDVIRCVAFVLELI